MTLIFFMAGLIQGMTGFGAGLLAMPLLAFFLDIRVAVPLCMLNGLIITAYLSLQLRKYADWQKIMPLLIGCLPGVVAGVALLKKIDQTLLKVLLGLLLIAYSGHRLLFTVRPRPVQRGWAYLAGFATGAISGAFSAGGPPTIIYTTLTGWNKDEIKATLSVFFFISGVATAIGHAVSGLTTVTVLGFMVVTGPAVFVGVALGSYYSRHFSSEGYIRLILVILLLLGILMIR
ncbi:MAG: sulfite exporter TauE/SafE family protein [Desulfobacterales bacterium]|nr:sulfite exporter TauE/SafE family protein [Desulfobacterales bacterium]